MKKKWKQKEKTLFANTLQSVKVNFLTNALSGWSKLTYLNRTFQQYCFIEI